MKWLLWYVDKSQPCLKGSCMRMKRPYFQSPWTTWNPGIELRQHHSLRCTRGDHKPFEVFALAETRFKTRDLYVHVLHVAACRTFTNSAVPSPHDLGRKAHTDQARFWLVRGISVSIKLLKTRYGPCFCEKWGHLYRVSPIVWVSWGHSKLGYNTSRIYSEHFNTGQPIRRNRHVPGGKHPSFQTIHQGAYITVSCLWWHPSGTLALAT